MEPPSADALHHAAELLELGDAFFELDRDGHIVRVNRNHPRRARLDLGALARGTAEDYRQLMGERGLELVVTAPSEPVVVDGDATGPGGREPALERREVHARRRAGHPGGAGAPRLVAVSGYAQPEDVRRSKAAGFDAHVAKPPDPELIERLLA